MDGTGWRRLREAVQNIRPEAAGIAQNVDHMLALLDAVDLGPTLAVLHEIGTDLGAVNRRISEEDRAVVFWCWALLDDAVDGELSLQEDLQGLREIKAVPNEESMLNPPGWMNRPGFAGGSGVPWV